MIDPETLAAENGFSHWAQMNMAAAVPLAEVRDMCAADRCGRYGHNWACPPGCGSLETAARRIAGYACGILVQTTGTLQDDFDYATIEAVGAAHKRRFAGFARQMRRAYPGCLPLTAGSCTLCARCTYPDRPCRYPKAPVVHGGVWPARERRVHALGPCL